METVVCSTMARDLVEKTLSHRLVGSTAWRENDLKDIHSQVQWLLLAVGLDLSQIVSVNTYIGTFSYDPGFLLAWWSQEKEMSLKQYTALCDSMDGSPPGSSVYGISQARILEQVAIPFSRGSSYPRDRTQASYIASRFFTL